MPLSGQHPSANATSSISSILGTRGCRLTWRDRQIDPAVFHAAARLPPLCSHPESQGLDTFLDQTCPLKSKNTRPPNHSTCSVCGIAFGDITSLQTNSLVSWFTWCCAHMFTSDMQQGDLTYHCAANKNDLWELWDLMTTVSLFNVAILEEPQTSANLTCGKPIIWRKTT